MTKEEIRPFNKATHFSVVCCFELFLPQSKSSKTPFLISTADIPPGLYSSRIPVKNLSLCSDQVAWILSGKRAQACEDEDSVFVNN